MNHYSYERQWPLAGYDDLEFSDFASAAFQDVLSVPDGAVIVRAFIVGDVAYNAATTATFTVGDAEDPDRYGSAIDVKTTGLKNLTPTGYVYPTAAQIRVTYASTGAAATAGSARLYIEYYVERKADASQE